LAKIALHDILQSISGVLCEAELFCRITGDTICITSSDASNERIRHPLSSVFAQQRIAKPSQQIQWAESNSWTLSIVTESDFGIVAEDCEKQTVKGRQFNNSKSTQLSLTIQTILFGKAIKLGRRLHHQPKLT